MAVKQHDIAREVSMFALPEGWQGQRKPVEGMTIDSERTMDRDDAISFSPGENEARVRVSISDVGAFLMRCSGIIESAEKQGETHYMSHGSVPMIPPEISEGKLSLLETQETPVLSVTVTLDMNNGIHDIDISRDRLQPSRMTYDEVAVFTKGKGDPQQIEEFRRYEQFALKLLERRRNKGAIAAYDPEEGLLTNEEGRVIHVPNSGELIVQEFMILANTAIAQYMLRHKIPSLFRNHAAPGEKAYYATAAYGHASLNLEAYVHWTSPLRRFADFANHANLAAFLEEKSWPYSIDKLDDIAGQLNGPRDVHPVQAVIKHTVTKPKDSHPGPVQVRRKSDLPSLFSKAELRATENIAIETQPNDFGFQCIVSATHKNGTDIMFEAIAICQKVAEHYAIKGLAAKLHGQKANQAKEELTVGKNNVAQSGDLAVVAPKVLLRDFLHIRNRPFPIVIRKYGPSVDVRKRIVNLYMEYCNKKIATIGYSKKTFHHAESMAAMKAIVELRKWLAYLKK